MGSPLDHDRHLPYCPRVGAHPANERALPYYLLADSADGRRKEQEVTGKILPDAPTHQDVRQGFVYERAPHMTLKSIANNAEIDVTYEKWQAKLEPLRDQLNRALGRIEPWQEWEIPREAGDPWKPEAATIHGILRDMIAERRTRREGG